MRRSSADDVDSVVGSLHVGEHRLDARGGGDVGADEDGLAARLLDLSNGLLTALGVDVGHGQSCPLPCERQGRGTADSRRRTRYESYLSTDLHYHYSQCSTSLMGLRTTGPKGRSARACYSSTVPSPPNVPAA